MLRISSSPALGVRRDHEAGELLGDPLGRDLADHVEGARDGGAGSGVQVVAELGGEADGAHRAQPVLREAFARIADRAEHAPAQVVAAAERIPELARERIEGERVDREVAAGEILGEVAVEGDRLRAAAVDVLPLPAEGGHLDLRLPDQDRDRAVVDAGGDDARGRAP